MTITRSESIRKFENEIVTRSGEFRKFEKTGLEILKMKLLQSQSGLEIWKIWK